MLYKSHRSSQTIVLCNKGKRILQTHGHANAVYLVFSSLFLIFYPKLFTLQSLHVEISLPSLTIICIYQSVLNQSMRTMTIQAFSLNLTSNNNNYDNLYGAVTRP